MPLVTMMTPRRTRVALSEIPSQLERLRVAATPTEVVADEPTPTNVLNESLLDDSSNNISQGDMALTLSPDEIVIRQRGPRRITLSWSPDKCASASRGRQQRTPTKANTSMTLRSSPRKRPFLDSSLSSPDRLNNNSFRKQDAYLRPHTAPKMFKMEDKPIAQHNTNVPLNIMLKGLSHDQLIDIINNAVKGEPKLEEKIRKNFPRPDLRPMEEQLNVLKRNIFKSLPTSRIVRKTDGTAYSRAVTHLNAFKAAIVSQCRLLHDSKHWDALIDYVILAWDYIRCTPVWENHSHNSVRRFCFKTLSWHCATALDIAGSLLKEDKLMEIETELKVMIKDSEEITSCISKVNKFLNKGSNEDT